MHKIGSLLCLLFPILLFGQNNQYMLTGTLKVNSGESFPYVLVFSESDGTIKGYSLTYKAPDETKTTITGTLDRRNHVLSFKETEIVYSHGYHTRAFMCLVDATLTHTVSAEGKVLSGPITNTEKDNTACTGGQIVFANQDEIQKLFASREHYDTVITMKRKTIALPAPPVKEAKPVIAPVATDKITANIEKTYDWHSDSVVIDIWDGGSQDGDKISLLYNGKQLLTNYMLVKEKKQLRLPVSANVINVITIVAENEGLDPPNTASFMLADDNIRYSVLAYNKKGQKAIIRLKKIKP